MEYFIVFISCIVGGALNIVCGFGVGPFCMMILPYVMRSTNAPAALINIVTLYQSVFVLWKYRRYVNWKLVFIPLASYFVASALAVRAAALADFLVMKRILGGFLIALSVYFVFFSGKLRLKPTTGNGLAAGGVAGVLSGLFAVGGPPAAMYFSATTEDKQVYLANLQGFYFVSNAYVIAMRALNGVITGQVLLYAAAGIAGMALGSVLGNRVFQKVNDRFILRAMYLMTAVSGLTMLIA